VVGYPLGGSEPSAAIQRVLHLVRVYAPIERPVVFTGPTGAGKGFFARLLHQLSGRKGGFVEVTGGQLTDSLLHSQLFGHVAGAFTGAQRNSRGAFEQAANGTLFLDEIQHWTLPVQSALLHVLGEGRVRPIGAERELPVSCRTVFASAIRLDDLVTEHRLLPDLRWRVAFLEVPIPPLCERVADILPLAYAFLEQARSDFGISEEPCFDHDAIALLLGYEWPGNLRELRGVVEFAAINAKAANRVTIAEYDFPQHMREHKRALNACPGETRQAAVEWMLERTEGNRSEAARRLGLHRNTVSRRGSVAARPEPVHYADVESDRIADARSRRNVSCGRPPVEFPRR